VVIVVDRVATDRMSFMSRCNRCPSVLAGGAGSAWLSVHVGQHQLLTVAAI
jgi:hypothetical protein